LIAQDEVLRRHAPRPQRPAKAVPGAGRPSGVPAIGKRHAGDSRGGAGDEADEDEPNGGKKSKNAKTTKTGEASRDDRRSA